MTPEKYLTLTELQDELAKVLPKRPARRSLYEWMAAGMPSTRPPGTRRRLFRLSKVLAWIDNPNPTKKAS